MEDKELIPVEKLTSFDLGEAAGGRQLIMRYKAISPTEYYVTTLGCGPRKELAAYFEGGDAEKGGGTDENGDIKIRFFKLTQQEGNRYAVEEYVTLEAVRERFFGWL